MSRKTTRKAITALLATIDDFVATYDYESKDFSGMSPVAMVHSDGSMPLTSRGNTDPLYGYIISLWWKRDGDGDDTEDYIDDLSDRVHAIIKADSSMCLPRLRPVNEQSQMSYVLVDSVQYRREQIRVYA